MALLIALKCPRSHCPLSALRFITPRMAYRVGEVYVRHRREVNVKPVTDHIWLLNGDTPRPFWISDIVMALMGRDGVVHQWRHQYFQCHNDASLCQSSEAKSHSLCCAPPAPFVRSWLLFTFSFPVECCSIWKPSSLGLLSSDVS